MTSAVAMVEHWRGPFLESVHHGHAVVCHAETGIEKVWGNPDLIVLPRSSAKMIQALPLIESGAAQGFGLTAEHLALACASHSGAPMHVRRVTDWLEALDLDVSALRCGPRAPLGKDAAHQLVWDHGTPSPLHSDCSGKHSGFLTVTKHIGAGPEYVQIDHPVQAQVREAWERVTGETVAGFGVDGCSAPNFATSLAGIARAMARYAAAPEDSAMGRLRLAMAKHPELVAGEDRACTNLMRALDGRVSLKTGAEGFFVAIIPEFKLGIALKIADGAGRAAECAITAILVKLGILAPDHPVTHTYLNIALKNWDGLHTGWQRAAPPLC
mgnify:CR=1 FL=1